VTTGGGDGLLASADAAAAGVVAVVEAAAAEEDDARREARAADVVQAQTLALLAAASAARRSMVVCACGARELEKTTTIWSSAVSLPQKKDMALRALLLSATPRACLRPLTRQPVVRAASVPRVTGAAARLTTTTTRTAAMSGSDPAAPFATVDVKEAADRLAAGTPILDVRTPAEFAGGHPPTAKNADWQSPDFLAAATAAYPDKDAPLLVSCLRGGRSAAAAAKLAEVGYSNLINVAGGWTAWVEAGLPEEK
jgi:rhodanese-related sulfurtransferase